MAQSTLNRLLIIPAIVLAATISLTGCANLPFFGGDSNSSNNSSNDKDDDDKDKDEDEDDDEDKDEDDDDDNNSSGGCPQQFLDKTQTDGAAGGLDFDSLTVAEIESANFEPAAIGGLLDDGCIISISYDADGQSGTMFEAFVPGGDDLKKELDAALVADGWDDSSEGFYVKDTLYLVVTSNEDSGISADAAQEQGLGFLGDEFLVIVTYDAS